MFGSIRQAHPAATSGPSATKWLAVFRMRVLGKQRVFNRLPAQVGRERMRANRKQVVLSGQENQLAKENGKGYSARGPSLASKGSAQNEWSVGAARCTRVARFG